MREISEYLLIAAILLSYLYIPFRALLKKVIIFPYSRGGPNWPFRAHMRKWSFFVTHGGSQLTFQGTAWESDGDLEQPAMRPRGNPQSDLKATRTDLEAGHNDGKRALPHPRKQRRRSLDILLCFLGCGRARLLSFRPASRSVQVASRSVRVASRSHVQVASWSQGTNFETKIFNVR